MNDKTLSTPLRKARLFLGLTTTEAGQYVHVTRKTWEVWEAGELNGKSAPKAKVELFFEKLERICTSQKVNYTSLVVVLEEDSVTKIQRPIDVVSADNFLGIDDGNIIKSMAVLNGRPYVHRVKFNPEHNPHVMEFVGKLPSHG